MLRLMCIHWDVHEGKLMRHWGVSPSKSGFVRKDGALLDFTCRSHFHTGGHHARRRVLSLGATERTAAMSARLAFGLEPLYSPP